MLSPVRNTVKGSQGDVMNKRKEILNEYKKNRLRGGVYTITNNVNGKYLIGHSMNIKSVQNHFQYATATGSTLHPKLREDCEKWGTQAFVLEVREELEQLPEQSQAAFLEDLQMLEQLWRTNLDASKEY